MFEGRDGSLKGIRHRVKFDRQGGKGRYRANGSLLFMGVGKGWHSSDQRLFSCTVKTKASSGSRGGKGECGPSGLFDDPTQTRAGRPKPNHSFIPEGEDGR